MTEFCTGIWNIFCLGDVYGAHASKPNIAGCEQKNAYNLFFMLHYIELKDNQVLLTNEKMKSWSTCKLAP